MTPKSVLLIDDEIEILEILSNELESIGLKVVTGKNAREALQLLEQQSFNLLITDFTMPGMSGIELIEKARALSHTFPAILLLTSNAVSKEKLINLGVNHTLAKPFNFELFALKVKEILEQN